MSPEKKQEWAALYVLGALTAEEREYFEQNLKAACLEEIRSLQEIAAKLGFSAPPEDPPSDLRDRLIEKLRNLDE